MNNWTRPVRVWLDQRVRPRGPIDAFGLVVQALSLAAFIGELIAWPADSLDAGVLMVRLATLIAGVAGYVIRRLVRKEPFDYVHWP